MSKRNTLLLSIAGIVLIAVILASALRSSSLRARAYGVPLAEASGENVPLSRLFSDTDSYVGKPVIVEARIGQVCQTAGCWITLTDGANQLMVQFYDFTVRLSPGARVRLFGELRVRNQAPYMVGRGLEVLR